jgi:hypothetical protein
MPGLDFLSRLAGTAILRNLGVSAMMVIEIEGGKWVSATPRITPRNFGKR